MDDASAIAVTVFREARRSGRRSRCLLLHRGEPGAYGCDFLMDAVESTSFVRAVDSPGVRLHLDAACMALAEDDATERVRAGADVLAHVHVSAPELGAVAGRRPGRPPQASRQHFARSAIRGTCPSRCVPRRMLSGASPAPPTSSGPCTRELHGVGRVSGRQCHLGGASRETEVLSERMSRYCLVIPVIDEGERLSASCAGPGAARRRRTWWWPTAEAPTDPQIRSGFVRSGSGRCWSSRIEDD